MSASAKQDPQFVPLHRPTKRVGGNDECPREDAGTQKQSESEAT